MNRLFLAVGCLIALVATDLQAQTELGKTRPVTKRKSGKISSKVKSIVIDNFCGDVIVESNTDAPSWKVKLQVTQSSRSSAKLILDELEIKAKVNASGELTWSSHCPYKFVQLPGIRSCVTFQVPAGVPVRVKNKKGKTTIRGVDSAMEVRVIDSEVTMNDLGGGPHKLNCVRSSVVATQLSSLELTSSDSTVEVTACTGNLSINGGRSNYELKQVGGDVEVTGESQAVHGIGIGGTAKILTSMADVRIKRVRGSLTIRTTKGEIVAAQVGGTASIENQTGDIKFYGSVSKLSCKSTEGNIRFVSDDPALKTLELESNLGNIQISLSGLLRPQFELNSAKGEVSNRFKSAVKPTGEPRVVASTESGNIFVITQPKN